MIFTRKNVVRTAALTASLLFGAALLPAQESDPAAPGTNNFGPRAQGQAPGAGQANLPAPELISTHGEWKVQCEGVPEGQKSESGDPKKQCGMMQTVKNEKNPKIGLTLVLVKSKQKDKEIIMMRVMAPIGVFLPTGVALEIDGAAVGRVPFTRCLPQICIAFAEAQPETLDKLRKGTAANFIIYEAPGLGLPMKISLSGFSAAFEALNAL